MKKRGFIATSLIYSFFLVFLMLMATILLRSVNNRILLNAIKDDIKMFLNGTSTLLIDTIENKTYNPGDAIKYAGEDWQVVSNKPNSVVLILTRGLNKIELMDALTLQDKFYTSCDDTLCLLRGCFNHFDGIGNCFLDETDHGFYSIPTWNPTFTQINNNNYGRYIPSSAVESWFNNHNGLKRALEKDKLILQNFSDGYNTYPIEPTEKIYVRLLLDSETTNIASFAGTNPFHILKTNTTTPTKIKIYDSIVLEVDSYRGALVRPVIEVKKG